MRWYEVNMGWNDWIPRSHLGSIAFENFRLTWSFPVDCWPWNERNAILTDLEYQWIVSVLKHCIWLKDFFLNFITYWTLSDIKRNFPFDQLNLKMYYFLIFIGKQYDHRTFKDEWYFLVWKRKRMDATGQESPNKGCSDRTRIERPITISF